LDEPENLRQERVSPTLVLAQVEHIRHRFATSVPTSCGPRIPFEVLDRAENQVRVRERRSGPHQLEDLG
jgi:hypothetical protein